MPELHPGDIVRYLQRAASPAARAGDAELLDRFVRRGDVAAFELLVWRHGKMVLGVCRRVLRNEHDAEDAFQATFLVLARKAGSIGRQGALAAWLYRVAYRAALAARRRSQRHAPATALPDDLPDATAADPAEVAGERETREVLEQLINALPAKYRTPFVLCCLEGKSPHAAARELGCPVGTVESWLSRARERLRAGLRRRDMALSVPLLGLPARALPADRLVAVTARTAATFAAASSGVRGADAMPAVRLAETLLRRTAMDRMKATAALLLLAGLLAAGAVLAEPQPAKTTPAAAEGDAIPKLGIVTGRVLDEGDHPVAGTRVWLRTRLKGDSEPRFQFRSTDADREGRFRFADVEPGNVTVAAVPPGRSYAAVLRSVQAGPQISDVVLRTRPAQTIRVRVVADDGRPVRGAELKWLAWMDSGPDWDWFPLEVLAQEKVPVSRTDRDGNLSVPGIPRGLRLRLTFQHPSFAHTRWEGTIAPDRVQTIQIDRGWPLTVEVVEAATGRPAPQATVSVTGDTSNPGVASEPVGADGRCFLRIGRTSVLIVRVHHPELIDSGMHVINVWPEGEREKTVRVELRRKGKVRGRVVDAKTGGPRRGARVELTFNNRRVTDCVSDARGRYEMDGPEGNVSLYLPGGTRPGAGAGPVSVAAKVQAGATTEAADLVAGRFPPLRGTVVRPDGTPAARALVMLDEYRASASAVTDGSGRFELTMNQASTGVVVAARHLNERLSANQVLLFDDLRAGKEVRIQLQPESEVRGTLVSGANKPLPRIAVRLQGELDYGYGTLYPIVATGVTDARGQYRFPGVHRLHRYRATIYPDLSAGQPQAHTDWIKVSEPLVVLPSLTAPADPPQAPDETRPAAADLHAIAWLNTRPLTAEALRGKVVLVTFWATWNAASVDKLSELQRLHDLYADKGLVVLAVHHNSVSAERLAAFIRDRKWAFPVALDDAAGDSFAAYDVAWLPKTVLIDRDGKVLSANLRENTTVAVRSPVLYGTAGK